MTLSRAGAATHSRKGATTFDLIATAIILGAVATIALPMLKMIKLERRAAVGHEEAVTLAASTMELLSAKPFSELTPEVANSTKLPDWFLKQVDDAKLKIEIADADNSAAKRIHLQLDWTAVGKANAPVRLTTWVYDQQVQP